MNNERFKNKKPKTVDAQLKVLENIKKKKDEIIAEETKTIKQIREGFEEVVIMFIDMVDSTKFKTANQDSPEKWITRVRQFSEIVGQYISECRGRIVKYIGDELLAVFARESKISDAINLLNRIKALQGDLSEITGEVTTVKIALDFGNVYFLKYNGHIEPDPQGTPVDRCARIAKYCKPGTALTSFDFVDNCDNPKLWANIGEAELKGIGLTRIFQFGEGTIEIMPTIEITKAEMQHLKDEANRLKSDLEKSKLELKDAVRINKELTENLGSLGKMVDPSLIIVKDSKKDKCLKDWDEIKLKILSLKTLISENPAPEYEYARFLFLYLRDLSWKYNRYTGDTFDTSIENELLIEEEGHYYLDPHNRRNKKAIEMLNDLEYHLGKYNSSCRKKDDNELFDYSLKSPEFWSTYIGYTVSR